MKTTYIMNIIRNSVKGAAVLFCAALVMAGCQRDGLADGVDSGDGQIRYSVKVAGGVKGALINTSGNNDLPLPADSSFFVSAYKGSVALFENKKATSKDGGVWTNDDPQYWPLSTKLAFFAYANTTAENIAMNAERTADTLVYTVPADASQHQDILLGYGYGDGGNRGVAEIRFEHPLTAVLFKEGTVSGDIKSITLSGLASGGKVAMTKGAIGDWTVGETEKYETVVTLSGGEDPLEVGETSKLIGEDSDGHYTGAFLLVPQKLAESDGGHPATVTVFLTTADGDVTVTADIASGEWKTGKTNTYTLNYGSATGFALTVTQWDEDGDTTLVMKDETGLLSGKFSVSPTEYVRFSKGNLRATRTSSTSTDWKLSFFEHQYDYTHYTSFSANDTEMSLFNWGFKDAPTSFNPVGNTTDGIEDWGEEYNRQHGLRAGSWRTLTGGPDGEWYYLLELRPNSHQLRGLRTVHGIPNCLVIVPDDFDTSKWPGDMVTDQQWDEMEAMGAVCLVPAGYREDGTKAELIGTYGTYWSSTQYEPDNTGYGVYFPINISGRDPIESRDRGGKDYGYSVRLVQKFEWPEVEPTFVDLGLPSGTLWADMNLGARSVGDPGKHFAWGEISAYGEAASPYPSGWSGSVNESYLALTSKTVYSWELYRWNVPAPPSRYVGYPQMYIEDDAAAVLLGDKAHTPSGAQWDELMKYCDNTKESNGWRLTSQKNGNSIFIPYNGFYCYGDDTGWATGILGTDMGHYWSVNNGADTDKGPWRCGITAETYQYADYYGWSAMGIRAVKPRENTVRPKFIDLDLPSGTLWADRNVGAATVTGIGSYGKYFAFGETSAYLEAPTPYPSDWPDSKKNGNYLNLSIKEWYYNNWNYYKWYNTDRYVTPGQALYPEDDAATYVLGDGYVTPSRSDWQELIDNCTNERVVKDGVIYYKFASKIHTDRYILLPYAGLVNQYAIISFDLPEGDYWASNVVDDQGTSTRFKISDYSEPNKIEILDDMPMSYGISVRAVKHVAD